MKSRKATCRICRWHGDVDELLIGEHPFVSDMEVTGCPNCREPGCCVTACDEDGCWQETTCK